MGSVLNRICKVIFLMIVIAEEARGETQESDYGSDKACLFPSQRMCVKMSEGVSVCVCVCGGGGDIWICHHD